jgi:hypothetical protein
MVFRGELPRNPNRTKASARRPSRVVTVLAAPVVVAAPLVMVMLAAEAAAAGAPHMGLKEELAAEAITEAEATQTTTSPAPHAAAMMPAAKLKKYDAISPPRQATTTASPPSPLDFAIYSSQRNSNLWGSPSTTRSKTQSNGSDAMPSPLKTLVSTMTLSHLFFQRKPSANLYACQDQFSCIY